MGVYMVPGNSYSGGVAGNGYVDVYPSFWNHGYSDPQHAGALLAHEEQHQNGMDWDHNTHIAQAYQDACYNTSA